MSKKKGIIELESIVKEIYAKDKTSPELYTALKDLAERILVLKKLVKTRSEVEEISHNLATDFYLRISSGELEVVCWTKYIQLTLLTYRNMHYSDTSKCQIVVDDASILHDFSNQLYSSSKFNLQRESSMEVDDYIKSIPDFLLIQFDKIVRYNKNTVEYTEVLISVLTSIIRKEYIVVNPHIYDDVEYVEVVVKCLMRRLNNYMDRVCKEDKKSYNLYDIIDTYKSFADQ